MILSHKGLRVIIDLALVTLMASVLIACSVNEPSSTSAPATSPSSVATFTPEPPTETPESELGQVIQGIILPTSTPKPTALPDALTELAGQIAEGAGLEEVSIFHVSVQNWLDLGLSLLLIIIIGLVVSRLVYYVLVKVAARTSTKYDEIFIKRIRSQIFVIIVTFGFQVGTVRLTLIEALLKVKISRLYATIYLVAAALILWRLVDVVVAWYKEEIEPKRQDPHQVDTMLVLLHRLARLLLITISLIMLLSLYNINVNALIAALGVGSLAISLAAQDSLSNVISGIMIMTDQPFRVGDRIEISKLGTWGDVIDIGLRSTRIRTSDNRLIIIPNNVISKDQIVNYTFPDPRYRIQVEIGVGYKQDLENVRQLIVNTVRQVEGVLLEKPVDAIIVNMGEYSMTIRVRWWIESYRDTRVMFDKVYTALLNALIDAGIEMPSDTYDVHILNLPEDKDGPVFGLKNRKDQ